MRAFQIVIGFGIAMMLPLLVNYGVKLVLPEPRFQDYVQTPPFQSNMTPEERATRDATQKEQRETYESASRHFGNILLTVATPIAVAAIFIGSFMGMQGIGTGLILGGILTLLWGHWSSWEYISDWLRFVSLLAGFVSLLFVGYRQMSRLPKSS